MFIKHTLSLSLFLWSFPLLCLLKDLQNSTVPTSLSILTPAPGAVLFGESVGVSWLCSMPFFAYVVLSVDNNPLTMVLAGNPADTAVLALSRPGLHTVTVAAYGTDGHVAAQVSVNITSRPSTMAACACGKRGAGERSGKTKGS